MSPPFKYKTKPCRRCGEKFTPAGANARWCSEKCKRGTAVCMECKNEFVVGKKAAGKFCSLKCFYDYQAPVGTELSDPSGYTITKVPVGTQGVKLAGRGRSHWMWTHRYVIQLKLGRPLRKTERVHHINGKRNDNSPDNLELWKRSHPAGVRAADYHCAGCRCFEPGFKCE